jgi:hypothetical protein
MRWLLDAGWSIRQLDFRRRDVTDTFDQNRQSTYLHHYSAAIYNIHHIKSRTYCLAIRQDLMTILCL